MPAKYSKKEQKCFNCRKVRHFKRECRSSSQEYKKKWGSYRTVVKKMIQMASKGKMSATKERMEESIDKFLGDLIDQASFVQDLLTMTGTILEEM